MKIINIEETVFKYPETGYQTFEGIVITLQDDTKYKIGIEDGQSCCEISGYITSHDNYDDFINAEFYDYYITTQDLCTIESLKDEYYSDMMFFTIKTSKGDLQFVAYNDHNGYYGHEVLVVKDDTALESECI